MNTYGYVSANPLSWVDPLGLARFGFRPLKGDGDYYDETYGDNGPSGSDNNYRAHEQLWFDDWPTENEGFFAGDGNGSGPQICGEEGDVRSDKGHYRDEYDFSGPVYDDNLMRESVKNIRDKWNDKSYCLLGNNCMNFADALRKEYDRLKK